LVSHFRYRKKGVANSSEIPNLQYVEQLIDWNAKTCPKKSVGKSLTRSANKYQGKSVNKLRNQNVNKFVSLYIGARFVNCDWTTINFLYKKQVCAIFVLQNFIYVDKIHFHSTRWPKTPKNMSSYKYICYLLMNITNLCITYNFVKFLSKSCTSNIDVSMRQYLRVDDQTYHGILENRILTDKRNREMVSLFYKHYSEIFGQVIYANCPPF